MLAPYHGRLEVGPSPKRKPTPKKKPVPKKKKQSSNENDLLEELKKRPAWWQDEEPSSQ